jgi:hypothetical protein
LTAGAAAAAVKKNIFFVEMFTNVMADGRHRLRRHDIRQKDTKPNGTQQMKKTSCIE